MLPREIDRADCILFRVRNGHPRALLESGAFRMYGPYGSPEKIEWNPPSLSERPVLDLVRALRAADFARIKTIQSQLQAVESEADDVLLEMLRGLYQPGVPSLKAVILKDLFDLIEIEE